MDLIEERARFSKARIEEFSKKVVNTPDLPNLETLCVYITGSYGRLEASKYSDLDLFFIELGNSVDNKLNTIDASLLNASLIRTAKNLNFPDFSGGGEYLVTHYLQDILRELGSPKDDWENYFTARMLLLLESKPILNCEVYNRTINELVETYFRDYHDHETDFLPVFLINDIHRFWRTLCLNFEHKRNRTFDDEDSNEAAEKKNKAHLKNLKLKFSRLMTCFSMISSVLSASETVTPTGIVQTIQMTPIERILKICSERPDLSVACTRIIDIYQWFLEIVDQPPNNMLEWIGIRENRDIAFSKAREFGSAHFELVTRAPKQQDIHRYLIV